MRFALITPAMLGRAAVLAAAAFALHTFISMASLYMLQVLVSLLGIALVAVAFNPKDTEPVDGGHDWVPPTGGRRGGAPRLSWRTPTPPRGARGAAGSPAAPGAPLKQQAGEAGAGEGGERGVAGVPGVPLAPVPWRLDHLLAALAALPAVPEADDESDSDAVSVHSEQAHGDQQLDFVNPEDLEAFVTPQRVRLEREAPGAPAPAERTAHTPRRLAVNPFPLLPSSPAGSFGSFTRASMLPGTGGVAGWGGCATTD
jgi:hypothetical protein